MKEKINSFIFNIKLQSKLTGDDRLKEYIRIVTELSASKNILQIGKNEGIQMYSVRGVKDLKIPKFIYGHIAKGTYIEDSEINVVEGNRIVKDVNKPRILKPETCDFLFIPQKHRLVVQKKVGGPTEKQVEEYLNKFLRKIVRKSDVLEIVLERDESVIEQIYKAKTVYNLTYEISYTNDDAIGHLGEDLEEIIKDSKIGKLRVSASADNKMDGLKIDDSVILEGGLQLAKANGTVKSAKILPEGSRKAINISNQEKPRIIPIEIDLSLGGKFRLWFNEIIRHLG